LAGADGLRCLVNESPDKLTASVHYKVSGPVAVLTLDRPPVNSLDLQARRELLAALARASVDPMVKGIVLTGGGKMFCAGADIQEFAGGLDGNTFSIPLLGEVVDAVQASSKPVIAAIAGTCFGGGLELALGCHGRVAAPGARFALPEIKLGILPGAGGTQRLPRLIGAEAALEIILSGEPVDVDRATTLGLVRLATSDLIGVATDLALHTAEYGIERPFEHVASLPMGVVSQYYFAAQVAGLKRRSPAAVKCVEAVRNSVELPMREGLRRELEIFKELIQTSESRALQYGFFSERAAGRIDGMPRVVPGRGIERIAVIGAGTMGTGIALCAANVGLPTVLIDPSAEALQRGRDKIDAFYEAAVKKGRLTAAQMQQRLACITTRSDLAAVASADLIIEAAFEKLSVKQEIFRGLDEQARQGAILASNTSTLDLNQIAAATRRPADVVGLHFFSPANLMRLLEVVRGEFTAPDVLATAMSFAKLIGKVGVMAGVCDGFIGNRMFEEYLRQAGFLLDEGALPAQVDGALQTWGMAMGPFAVMDLAGGDIAWAIRQRRAVEQPDRPYSKIPDRVCELGRFGQKTGAGYYRYDPTRRGRDHDPDIDALVIAHSRQIGLSRRAISDEEIVSRCILALVNEGAQLLAERIAQRASDIDVVYRTGYGFPAERGGPMFYADQQGLPAVIDAMRGYAAGYHGECWQPAPLLCQYAAAHRRLTDI
jgi:3-hydroxyacyl-CoA dehydrogenase